MNNYFAVGNDELGEEVKKGDLIHSISGHIGEVGYGTTEDGIETNILGFITAANGTPYLVAVNGRLIKGCIKL